MNSEPLIFERKGFPSIKLFEHYFQIKERHFRDYLSFNYEDLKSIEYYNPNSKWWMRIYIHLSLAAKLFSHHDPWVLKVTKKNGAEWKFNTSPVGKCDFYKIVKSIDEKII